MTKSTLSLLVQNRAGTLVKVATVISGRGLNIHEMTARIADDGSLTAMEISFVGDADKVRQVGAQLEKMEVVKKLEILDYTAEE